jgi:hypothetical protein
LAGLWRQRLRSYPVRETIENRCSGVARPTAAGREKRDDRDRHGGRGGGTANYKRPAAVAPGPLRLLSLNPG